MDALAFLDKSTKSRPQPVYVLAGDEDFLKRRVLALLVPALVGESDPDLAVSNYPGDKADFSTIRNELDTLPFLSDRRVIVVDQADPFVTKNRGLLEKYVAAPSEVGVLILEVKSWTATTNLAKAIPEAATILCKAPAAYKLPDWCVKWALAGYGKKLSKPGAEMLVELVGAEMGVLDQELQKLATVVGEAASIDAKQVQQLVGRSRAADAFRIMDAIGNGKPDAALGILAELFEEGLDPLAILGPLGYQLRQLARIARLYKQGMGIEEALTKGGVRAWPETRDSVRRQLKHLGAARLEKLYDWLLDVDSGMKGGSPLPERLQMERLIVRLARAKPVAP